MAEDVRDTGDSFSDDHGEIPIGKNFFLGIGINSYKNFKQLNNAEKDVEDVATLLSTKYTFEPSNIEKILSPQATRRTILKKLHEYQDKIEETDKLLIYYAGHGYLNKKNGLGYWIPVDAEKDEVADFISNAEIREIIRTYKAKHILLISDSCFSASLLVREAPIVVKGAFKDWEKSKSRFIFTSGKGVVGDGEKDKNSPFAAGIIKTLSSNDFEPINIALLADEVTKNVKLNYEQQAEVNNLFQSGDEGGQFVFYPKAHISGFQKVVYLFLKGQIEEAVLELKNYLLNSNSLPHAYTQELVILANMLRKIKKHRINESDLNDFVDSQIVNFLVAHFEDSRRIHVKNKLSISTILRGLGKIYNEPTNAERLESIEIEIINLIIEDEIEIALQMLLKKWKQFSDIKKEIYPIIAWLYEAKRIEKIEIISLKDSYLQNEKYIKSIFITVGRIDNQNKKINSRFWLLQNLIANSMDYHLTIAVLREIILFENGTFPNDDEAFSLIKMLENRLHQLIHHKISLNYREKEIERSRIISAILHLADKIESKAFEPNAFFELEIKNETPLTKSKLVKLKKLFIEGNLKLIIKKIPHDDFLCLLYEEIKKNDDIWNKGIINTEKWLEKKERYIHIFYNHIFGGFKNSSANIKLDPIPRKSRKETLSHLRHLICESYIGEACDIFLNLKINQNYRNLILNLKKDFLGIEEDDLFTDKDKELIFSRKCKVAIKLFELLGELEKAYFYRERINIILPSEEIRALIEQGKIEKALRLIDQCELDLELKNQVSIGLFSYNSSQREYRLNLIDDRTHSLRISSILEKTLKIIT